MLPLPLPLPLPMLPPMPLPLPPPLSSLRNTIHLQFSLGSKTDWSIAPLMSHEIRARGCSAAEFFSKGDTHCTSCPTGAFCNGSDTLVAQDGFWRVPGSHSFLACPIPRGRARPPCARGAGGAAAPCAPGFEGPLCARCAAGHAGDDCAPCDTSWVLGMSLSGTCLAYIGLLAFKAWKAFTLDPDSDQSMLVPMIKMLVTYAQVAQVLRPLVPAGAGRTVAGAGTFLSLELPVVGLRCSLPELGALTRFYMTMALPVPGLLVVLGVLWLVLRGRTGCSVCRRGPAEGDRGPDAAPPPPTATAGLMRGSGRERVVLVGLSVVLYVLYTSLIKEAARLQV